MVTSAWLTSCGDSLWRQGAQALVFFVGQAQGPGTHKDLFPTDAHCASQTSVAGQLVDQLIALISLLLP